MIAVIRVAATLAMTAGFWHLCSPLSASPAHASEQPITMRATRQFSMVEGQDSDGVDHPWLSNHELLHFKAPHRLFRYDITTKSDVALAELSKQINTSGAYAVFVDTSRDGKWVMWGKSGNNPTFVAPVNGSARYSYPGNDGLVEPYWCGGGSRLASLYFGGPVKKIVWTEAQLHDPCDLHFAETIKPLPTQMSGLDVMCVVSDHVVITRVPDRTEEVKFGPPIPNKYGGDCFSMESRVFPTRTQHLAVWDLHKPRPTAKYTYKLPHAASEVEVSPSGKNLAWILTASSPKRKDAPSGFRMSLYTSHLDGSHMQYLGYVVGDNLSQPRWSPDERQLSFISDNSLWVVPSKVR